MRQGDHFLDWSNEPSRFKEYVGLEPIGLPPFHPTGIPAHGAVHASARCDGGAEPDITVLSHLLFHGAGVAREVRGPGGSFHFRTYAAAGALYPNEVYVVGGDLDGLDAGVYHYGPRDHSLRRLRAGDYRGNLGLAGESPGSVVLVLTGIPWRTAWKYEARGFRHLYWDAGMMVANFLASSAAHDIGARAILGFVDRELHEVLGLDGRTEFGLCLLALGQDAAPPGNEPSPLALRVAPTSPRPRRDPAIEAVREAITLRSEVQVRAFRSGPQADSGDHVGTGAVEAPSITPEERLSTDTLEAVVRRRGSTRGLAREPFPAPEFAAILEAALGGFLADWSPVGVEARAIAPALEGLPAGAYACLPGSRFIPIRDGNFRRQAGFLCLEQRLGAEASATTFLMADLGAAVRGRGARGYAAAQLEAAVAAGRLYLGAYAQCLGASGITFYDDEVRRFLDTETEPMLTVVMGPEARRRSIRRCREALRPV